MNFSPEKFINLLACPDCRKDLIKGDRLFLCCSGCGRDFGLIDGNILDLRPSNPLPMPDMYKDPEYLEVKKRCEEIFSYIYDSNTLVARINNSYHKFHKKLIDKFFKNGEWIVDLGCGTGNQLKHFQEHIHNFYLGLDSNLELLQICRKSFSKPCLILGDFYHLPFKSQRFNNVLTLGVLEHVYFLDKALEEVERILDDEGHFHITIPTEGGLMWNLGRAVSTQRQFRKMGINYEKYIKIEHCNTAKEIINALNKTFHPLIRNFYPFVLPAIHFNLLVNGVYKKTTIKTKCSESVDVLSGGVK